MNGKRPEISIVIPALNEEDNIRDIVSRSRRAMEGLRRDFEVLVVNDGSSDNTRKICEEMSKEDSRVRVIHHERNEGIGPSLKDLFKNAAGELIFFIAADGQQDPAEITNFLEAIKDNDIVYGIRKKRVDPPVRKLTAWLWRAWIRFFFSLDVKDLNWVKMYRAGVFDTIQLEADSAFIDAEILIKARQKGLRIKGIFTGHYPRKFGRQSGNDPSVVLRAFRDFFRLYRKIRNVA